MKPAYPSNEAERVEDLFDYELLDSPPERDLDDITSLAAGLCGAPISMISLVDSTRQWFKSKVGIDVCETNREISFCGHAILQGDMFIVPDASQDIRFADNPMVTGDLHIRSYAGAPLVTPSGHVIGALCVMDRVPRQLSDFQLNALRTLSRQVMSQFELRRQRRELALSEDRLRIVTDNVHIGLVIVGADRRYLYANAAYYEIQGLGNTPIIGKRLADVLPGLYEEQIRPRLDLAFAGNQVEYQLRKPANEGDRYFNVRCEPKGKEMVIVVIVDVTETKRSELASVRLAAIVESSDDAIISKDLNGIVTSWNGGAERLFGYSSKEMVGSSITRIIPDDRLDEEDRILGTIRRGLSVEHFETLRRTKDGRVVHVSVTASPIRDSSGIVTGASKIARDITGRVLADEDRRESEARVRAVLTSLSEGVVYLNAAGEVEMVNDSAELVLGRTFRELTDPAQEPRSRLLRSDGTLFGIDEHPAIVALRTGKGVRNVEMGVPMDDGGVRWLSVNAELVRDASGRVLGAVASFFDISERRVAEAERRSSEERFRQVVENIHEVFWMTDVEKNRMLYVSPGYEKIWGRSSASLYSSPEAWIESVHPEDRGRVLHEAKTKQVTGEYDILYRIIRPDGAIRWIHDKCSPVLDGAGRAYRIVGTAEDITDRRRLEEQFHRAQKMEALGSLAGGIAHDFNNILTGIGGYTELLRDTPRASPDFGEFIEAISQATKRATSLVRQILSFSRREETQRGPTRLAPVVDEVTKFLRSTIPASVEIRASIDLDLPMVIADPTQVHQVVMNLCTNAAHAMREQGGKLGVNLDLFVADKVTAELNPSIRPGRYVKLSVSDTGVGMDSETLSRIFEPFFTTKPQGEGTGLGLAVVHGIMQTHGGAVTVYSKPGQGSVFNLYFPAAMGADSGAGDPIEPVPKGDGERILYVDDEVLLARLGEKMLERLGYAVESYTDVFEALSLVRADPGRFDLVVTDYSMPTMNGMEFARELLKIRPDLPIIVATGYAGQLTIEKLRVEGARELLLKPLTIRSLGTTIRPLLARDAPK